MRRTRSVLFDLDDTLVADDAHVVRALFATCAGHEGVDATELFRSVWSRAWAALAEPPASVAAALGIGGLECLVSDFVGCHASLDEVRRAAPAHRRRVWRGALAEVGVADEKAADELAECFRERRRANYVLRPGALELLDAAERFRLAVVSNGAPDVQGEKLEWTGIGARFEAVAISGVEGVAKPDARLFALALDRLGVAREEALMIGDDPAEDLGGARAAGLEAILLHRDDRDRAGHETRTAAEIEALLRDAAA